MPQKIESGNEAASFRFYELDSLRGLAAITVVFHHFSRICPESFTHLLIRTPLRLLIAGHQAVILFFLLSGFVLTQPYKKKNTLSYGHFLLKRVCRIYLPYLGALALAILCDLSFPAHGPSNNYWINYTWSQPVTARLVLQHVIFLGVYNWSQFNAAFWSLVYEMRISLVFPFIAVAVLRLRSIGLSFVRSSSRSVLFQPRSSFQMACISLTSTPRSVPHLLFTTQPSSSLARCWRSTFTRSTGGMQN
jgi:peptidoglycan/LPS O-acetylase OafA/YrhL